MLTPQGSLHDENPRAPNIQQTTADSPAGSRLTTKTSPQGETR